MAHGNLERLPLCTLYGPHSLANAIIRATILIPAEGDEDRPVAAFRCSIPASMTTGTSMTGTWESGLQEWAKTVIAGRRDIAAIAAEELRRSTRGVELLVTVAWKGREAA